MTASQPADAAPTFCDASSVAPTTDEPEDLTLTMDAFVRSIGVRRTIPHALFLGAGASVSSGIPSAEKCIWEWKRQIFLTNNPGLEDQFSELSLDGVRRRIQRWLDRQGSYPKQGAPEEYGFYIKQCFPIEDDRRAFFQERVRTAQPHIGYQLLSQAATDDLFRSVWTTNFDGLAARAAGRFTLSPIEVGIDSKARVNRDLRKGELLCVSMHGDYRYDELKNTAAELQTQEAELRAALIAEMVDTSLVICGYSGRDDSVMEALSACYSQPGGGVLYWCGFSDGDIPERVATLIRKARAHGRQAYYVPTLGFDDLMTRLALHCLQGEARKSATKLMEEFAPKDKLTREPFQIGKFRSTTLIKSNAFPIECRIVQKQNRRRSGGSAMVIVEHSTETLAPMYRLRWRDDWVGPQELVFEALMIALNVVVRHELGDCVLKRGLSEEDHSVQALGFYGAHKALGERI